jgi:SnoaL-like protein
MAIHLAKPIKIYFASENAHDIGRLDRCFAADAMVRDEGRTIKGIAAIKAWRSETREKYHHTVEPLSVTVRNGKTVVTAKVSGNFPGSPVTLDHVFELRGDRIVTLEIH